MKKKWLSALLAVSMLLSPSYLFAGNAQALSVGTDTSKMVHAAPIDQEVYEAEEAVLMGATLAENLDDFSGNGFVDGMETGSKVVFTVTVPDAGDYAVRLRYSNGSGENKTMSLYANDEKVRTFTLPKMINWDTWGAQTENVPLQAGKNTIAFLLEEGDTGAGIKLDCISLADMYEAEDAESLNGNKVMSDHQGYSGEGFAAGFEDVGSGVRFIVETPEAGMPNSQNTP